MMKKFGLFSLLLCASLIVAACAQQDSQDSEALSIESTTEDTSTPVLPPKLDIQIPSTSEPDAGKAKATDEQDTPTISERPSTERPRRSIFNSLRKAVSKGVVNATADDEKKDADADGK